MNIPFPVGTNQAVNPFISRERLYNLYAEVVNRPAVAALYRTPGTQRLPGTPVGNLPARGAFSWQDVGYMVVGDKLLQISKTTQGWQIDERGTLNTTEGRVDFAADLDEIGLTDGVTMYVYNVDSGLFTTVTDADLRVGSKLTNLNGFWISSADTSNVWQISRPQLADDWDALDIAVGESSGSNVQAHDTFYGRVWIFKSDVTEVWAPSTTDFPFSRQAVLNVGCGAPHSIAKTDKYMVWLDWHGRAQRTVGLNTEELPGQAFADAVSEMSTFRDAFAYVYTERKHTFYVVTFPTANQTWAFDFETGQWAERGYRDPVNDVDIRHHANCHMYVGQCHVVGDFRDGRIYVMSSEFGTDDGGLQRWEAICPLVFDPKQPDRTLRFYDFVLHAQTGVGTAQLLNPELRLSYSDDGGHTWSDERNRQLNLGVGLEGFQTNLKWRRFGRCKQKGRVWRIRGNDDVLTSLIGATAKVA